MSAESNAIEAGVSAILADCGIVFSAVLVDGNAVDENGWKYAAWKVAFSGQGRQTFATPYSMGTAHREIKPGCHVPPGLVNWQNPRTLFDEDFRNRCTRPTAPTAATVLHSLLSDASAADSTFEDWAADMGLDSDSRKALAEYLACQETAVSLRRIFGSAVLEKLSDAVRCL